MNNHGTPKTRIEKLEKAILRLEKLTRDCHDLAKEYWENGDRDSKTFRHLEDNTAEKIAVCIAEILYKKKGRVFVAPRYRPRAKVSGDTSEPANTDFIKFAIDFGQFAVGGSGGVITVKQPPFMPVAFWNYHIYEKPIVILGPDGNTNEVKVSGFAGWTKDHFLGQNPNFLDNPIFGFHFSLKDIPDSKPDGLLHLRIPERLTPSEITEYFLSECKKKITFYGGPENKIDFPIITGVKNIPEPNAESIVKTIFSTLFYSNFKRPNLNSCVLASSKQLNIDLCERDKPLTVAPETHKSILDAATYLFEEYCAYTNQAGDTEPLAFDHYYAFLLNPSINFGSNDGAAIGTVNVYTDKPIPPLHTALIRKHIESIYHLLREIEDWEEATKEGQKEGKGSAFRQMQSVTGHELMHIYTGADNAMSLIQNTNKSDCKITLTSHVVKSALTYGLLWGGSAHSLSHPISTTISALAKEALEKSWEIFVGGHVIFTDPDLLTDDQTSYINDIWSTDKFFNRFDFYDIDDTGILFLALDNNVELRKALFRWHLVAFVNTLRHRIIGKERKSVDVRFDKLKSWLNCDDLILKYQVITLDQSITFSITNHYEGPPSYPPMTSSTGLALELAREEIESCLHKARFKNMYTDPSTFHGIEPCWTTSLTINGFNSI